MPDSRILFSGVNPAVMPGRGMVAAKADLAPIRRVASGGVWGRLRRSKAGVTAVEMALIMPIFLVLVFAVLEVGLEFLTQVVLDHAVIVGARQLQIGNASTSALLKTSICNAANAALISSCSSNLQIYVTSGSSFSSMTVATVNAGVLSPSTFTPGGTNASVLMQVAYKRPYIFTLLSSATGSSFSTMLSTVALQSEPY